MQVYHPFLKKYFSNSTKSLDKFFMKNNHHLDFLQGLFSASGIETAFFHSKKWLNMLKIDFLGCHGNGQVVMNTYWFNLRIKMFCLSIFTILLLKVLDYINFMTHNLNLLSYIELVGGVFAPLLFVFYIICCEMVKI